MARPVERFDDCQLYRPEIRAFFGAVAIGGSMNPAGEEWVVTVNRLKKVKKAWCHTMGGWMSFRHDSSAAMELCQSKEHANPEMAYGGIEFTIVEVQIPEDWVQQWVAEKWVVLYEHSLHYKGYEFDLSQVPVWRSKIVNSEF
jgi:hypothetical protein